MKLQSNEPIKKSAKTYDNCWMSTTKERVNEQKAIWDMQLKDKSQMIVVCDSAMQSQIKMTVQSPYCIGYKWIE